MENSELLLQQIEKRLTSMARMVSEIREDQKEFRREIKQEHDQQISRLEKQIDKVSDRVSKIEIENAKDKAHDNDQQQSIDRFKGYHDKIFWIIVSGIVSALLGIALWLFKSLK